MIFKISKFGFFSMVFVMLMTVVTQTWALDGEQGDLVAGDSVSAVVSSGDADARVSETEASAEPSGDTISLDFKDADINTVLRILSMKSGMNIVSGPEVKGVVTVRLDNVPWDKALNVILRTYDYVYERDGNIIRVTSREKMGQEPVETKTFILNYSKAAEIQSAVQDILTERGRIKVAERTNMVVVTDIPTNLYRIGEVIENLDKVTPQAYVDSKIINTDSSYVENMGIQWTPSASITGATRPTTFPFSQTGQSSLPGSLQQFFPVVSSSPTPAAGTTPEAGKTLANVADARNFPYPAPKVINETFAYGTLDFSKFAATLEFLKTKSNTKIVSNPRVVVLNNQTAHIQVGSQIPIPSFERNETTGSMEVSGFSFRDVGVVLKVTPHINSAQEIMVDLNPEVSTQGANVVFTPTLAAPSFNVTQASTQVLIQSGQTIAIGGLMTDNSAITETKVPYLGDIPFFGKIFRSKRQTPTSNAQVETLFFVTVTMVDSQGQPVMETVDDQAQNLGSQTVAPQPDKATP